MPRVYIPIEFNDDELLKEAKEIQEMADALVKKAMHFKVKIKKMEEASSNWKKDEEA